MQQVSLGIDYEHTGPDRPAGRLLRRWWHPIWVADELKVAQPVPVRLMNEDFTLYRGEDGTPHVIDARCAHRGLVMSVGKVEGDCIRCRYHGWKYDASGQCTEQPFERKSFAAKVRLKSYPVEEYLGFIWLYIGELPAPPLPRWPGLEKYGRFPVVELRKWNYFHDLENTVDDVHQLWVHREGLYQDGGRSGEVPQVDAKETEYGLMQWTTFDNGFVRRLALMMPNMLYFNSGAGILRGFKSFLWNVPVDDTSHKMFFLFVAEHLPPDVGARVATGARDALRYVERTMPPVEELVHAVLGGRMRFEDIPSRPDLVLIEDGVMLVGQGILPDRSTNRLGSSDAAIILLRRIYAREMAALEQGRPGATFASPDEETFARIDAFTGEPVVANDD